MGEPGKGPGRLRVLLITPDFPVDKGGIQSLAGGLARHLNVDLDVVTRSRSAGGSEASRRPAVRRSPDPPRLQRTSIALLNLVASQEALVRPFQAIINMHVNTAPAAALATRLRGIPFVQYLHAQEIPVRPALTRFAVRRARATIAVSSHSRALAERIGCETARFHVIPPGIDPPSALPPSDRGGPPTVLTVARFEVAYKGHDVLVEAMPAIHARVPEARWILIGDGPLRSSTEQRVDQLGLTQSVQFLRQVSDAERDRWLAEADVFAMPSRLPPDGTGEGFGIVFLEAAAHGLPVVAGNVGGALDAVVDGTTGVLVDPQDPAALADAVCGLLLDPDRAKALGAAGIAWSNRFAWREVARAVEELLFQVVSRSRR